MHQQEEQPEPQAAKKQHNFDPHHVESLLSFCMFNGGANEEQRDLVLSASSTEFLQDLNLERKHPFCQEASESGLLRSSGSSCAAEEDEESSEETTTWGFCLKQNNSHNYAQSWTPEEVGSFPHSVAASVLGLLEIVTRIWAVFYLPLGILLLLARRFVKRKKRKQEPRSLFSFGSPAVLTLLCACALIVTDALVMLDLGLATVSAAWILTVVAVILFGLHKKHHHHPTKWHVGFLLAILLLGLYSLQQVEHISHGFYYDSSNAESKRIVHHWPQHLRSYDTPASAHGNKLIPPTPWAMTGDFRTLLPYLVNKVPPPPVTRVWLPVEEGREVVALDISFPPNHIGGYNASNPMYLVLHGLNAGSKAEYIKDFTWHQIRRGCTVVVMVARGYMNLPLRTWRGFHAARWQDAHEAAHVLKQRVVMAKSKSNNPNQQETQPWLIGVGFSLGGVILNNMVFQSGRDCALDAAVSISGGLDMLREGNPRSRRLWHPVISAKFRGDIVLNSWGERRIRQRLQPWHIRALHTTRNFDDLDRHVFAPYHGFDSLEHYYAEIGALGDVSAWQQQGKEQQQSQRDYVAEERLANLSIPLFLVHSIDDPIMSIRTIASSSDKTEGRVLEPRRLVQQVSNSKRNAATNSSKAAAPGGGQLFVLLTKRGGHIGWPLGWNPSDYGWSWMHMAASGFVDALQDSFAAKDAFEAAAKGTHDEELEETL